jgi:copper homeostasis protein
MLLEVCVEDAEGLAAAIAGGADRIELCSALAVGGLTPSAGLMALAARYSVPTYAMIRPRAGSFQYTADEIEVMKADIDAAGHAGLAGVVLGASLHDGRLDADTLNILIEHADGLGKTLHRAFDLVPDMEEAIELAISLDFERILTSGRAGTALDGVDDLEQAIDISAGRISIMPGSGVNGTTIDQLLPRLKIIEIHSSCSVATETADRRLRALGFAAAGARRTDAATVRALKARLD